MHELDAYPGPLYRKCRIPVQNADNLEYGRRNHYDDIVWIKLNIDRFEKICLHHVIKDGELVFHILLRSDRLAIISVDVETPPDRQDIGHGLITGCM